MPASFETIGMKRIDVDPKRNVRKHDKASIAELAASMEQVGLLQPIGLVQTGGARYRVVFGFRRHAAAQKLKWPTITALVVLNVTAEQEAAAQVAENLERTPLSLREEVDAVGKVQAAIAADATIADVAEALGKHPRWVAHRLALVQLIPGWWKAAAGEKHVPRSLLYALARRSPEQQEVSLVQFTKYGWKAEDVQATIARDQALPLVKAPWLLDDAKLVPAAGACNGCPYRGDEPLPLFPDAKLHEKPTCLNAICYDRKLAASVRRTADLAAKDLGVKPKILVESGSGTTFKEEEAVRSYAVKSCPKDAKGAFPVIPARGANAGKVQWVKPDDNAGRGGSKAGLNGEAGPREPKTDASRLRTLRRRRLAHAVRSYAEQLPSLPCSLQAAVAFVIAWGTDEKIVDGRDGLVALEPALNLRDADWHKHLFARVVGVLQDRLFIRTIEDDAETKWQHAHVIAASAGHLNDLLACLTAARAAIAIPASLQKAAKKAGLDVDEAPAAAEPAEPAPAEEDRKKAAAGERDA